MSGGCLALPHVWLIEADLRRSRWSALAGGLLVVAGAVLFFIATAGPAYVPVLTPRSRPCHWQHHDWSWHRKTLPAIMPELPREPKPQLVIPAPKDQSNKTRIKQI